MSEDATDGTSSTVEDEQSDTDQDVGTPDTGDALAGLKAQLESALKDAEKWKATSRKHEGRAKENAEAASKAKTVEQRLAEYEKREADREARELERSGRLAVAKVEAKLAGAGFNVADLKAFLDRVPPASLLSDGEPDTKAIDELAQSLIKASGRTTPDRDQGRGGGSAGPLDMNSIIRRKAGLIT